MQRTLSLLVLFMLLAASMVNAATPAQPAYRTLRLVEGFPWNEGLRLEFIPDEELCKKHYGGKWRSMCAAAMGRVGDTVKNIVMTPAAEGFWQWVEPSQLQFFPANPESIKPATSYRIELGNFYPRAVIKLKSSHASLKTLPLACRLLASDFWIDPSPHGRNRVTASFQFNYPPPKGYRPELIAPAGAAFGEPELVWNENHDLLNISFAVDKLPETPSQAGIFFTGLGQIALVDGSARYFASDEARGALFHQNMPGARSLFKVGSASLKRELNDELDRRYVLEFETSLYAAPEDVSKNLVVFELPRYNTPGALVPYNWSAAPGVPPDLLKKSKKLSVAPLQVDNMPRSKFRFAINPEAGHYVLAFLQADLTSTSGKKLQAPWINISRATPGEPELGFMQPGSIMPLADNGILDLFATDVDRIEWEAQMVEKPFLALLASASMNAFVNPLGGSTLDMDSISTVKRGRIDLGDAVPGNAQFSTLDVGSILKNADAGNGLVFIRLAGYRKDKAVAEASRLVLATRLGLVVKKSATGVMDCFVRNILDGEPAKDARISILGANGRPVAEAQADADGFARFPALSNLKRESRPVAAIAESDGMLAFMPLDDRARELNYSEFPTGGMHTGADDVNVYVFGERGIYRPGDSLHFGCVARKGDFAALAPTLPLYAEIIDPRGIKVWEKNFRAGEYGLAALEWTSPQTALSGKYVINIRPAAKGAILGSSSARLEEFQPDALKMKITLPEISGWLPVDAGNAPAIGIALQNLFGTPAAGHKVRPMVETMPPVFSFKGYEGFIFTDAMPWRGNGNSRRLPECVTDGSGRATFNIPHELLARTSASIRIVAEGFDAAGSRPTIGSASFIASPMRRILGYRPLGSLTNPDFIPVGSKAELEFMALEPDLEKTAWNDLHFSIARRQYVTSLVSDGNGGFRYDETPASVPLREWTENLPRDGMKIALDTSIPGEFLLLAKDADGRIVSQMPYAVAGNRAAPPNAPLATAKMRIRLDRSEYDAGDTIKVAISTPYDGFGMLSIEREGVNAFTWFMAQAGDSVQQIELPEGFAGKGYVVASFTRSPASDAIYMAPHTWAVASFNANIKKHDAALELKAPDTILPGGELEIHLASQAKGFAIISAVDEGILQLTGFKTPNPLASLLEDRALDVRTLQAYDLLMPDHAKIASRLAAFGGGMSGVPFGMRFENPFKRRHEPPVAFWSGIVATGPEGATVKLPLPDYYNGKIRIMAVGVSAQAAGSATADTLVRGPLVASPNLPPAVSPGDVFEGSLTVANTTDADIKAGISMKTPACLEIQGAIAAEAVIPAGGEKVLPFRLKAMAVPGAATLDFKIAGAGVDLDRNGFMSIRPPATMLTTLDGGIARASGELPTQRAVYPQKAASVATISAVPIPLATGFAQYLSTYPYGCTEQLVSRAYAQVLLRAWPIQGVDAQLRQKLLESTLTAIRERFNGNGVSLWPGGEPELLLTAYAADFLLAMRIAGLGGGDELLAMLCDALAANCQLNEPTLAAARNSAYAIWVLTKEGRVTTQLLENLQKSMEELGIEGWRNDLAGALVQAIRAEMHMPAQAPEAVINETSGWFDEYAQYALNMAILCRYFPDRCDDRAREGFYEATLMSMNGGKYATFSACQGINAIVAIAAGNTPEIMQARIACLDDSTGGSGSLLANGAMYSYSIDQCSRYHLEMPGGDKPVFWQIATTGYGREPVLENVARGLEVQREYANVSGEKTSRAMLGDEVTVTLSVRAMRDSISNCVITDMVPGGFEMVIPRNGENDENPASGIKFMDRQEDRMLIFADVGNKPLVFKYKIRPVAMGAFFAPATTAQSMYDSAIYGSGPNQRFEVAQ